MEMQGYHYTPTSKGSFFGDALEQYDTVEKKSNIAKHYYIRYSERTQQGSSGPKWINPENICT